MKLYELTNDYKQIFELIESEEFNLDTLEDTIQSIEGNIEVKIENIARMIRNWEAQALSMKDEEKRLKQTREALENRVIAMKDYVLDSMTLMNKDKITTAIGNVCRQKNPLSVDVFDMNAIPDEYVVIPPVEPKPDKKSILLHFKATGEILPGTRMVQSYHLRIR